MSARVTDLGESASGTRVTAVRSKTKRVCSSSMSLQNMARFTSSLIPSPSEKPPPRVRASDARVISRTSSGSDVDHGGAPGGTMDDTNTGCATRSGAARDLGDGESAHRRCRPGRNGQSPDASARRAPRPRSRRCRGVRFPAAAGDRRRHAPGSRAAARSTSTDSARSRGLRRLPAPRTVHATAVHADRRRLVRHSSGSARRRTFAPRPTVAAQRAARTGYLTLLSHAAGAARPARRSAERGRAERARPSTAARRSD